MKRYVIKTIYSDGYDRFAVIKGIEHNVILNVHFLEYSEYIENGETSRKIGDILEGDILEGDISIELVSVSKKVDKELMHYQGIQDAPHVEAIVEVAQIINEYSLYAYSSILDDNILIQFENAVDYKVGDRVFIIGSLEMNEI